MHTIALSTYGTLVQRGTSCLKCVNAVPIILLRLFGNRAQNLTRPRASYSYIDVPGAHLTHNFLVLKLTDAEKALVEDLIRPQPLLAQAFLWQDDRWYEFPHGRYTEYRLASSTGSSGYPRFSGSAARSLTPSAAVETGEGTPAPTGQITIRRSARAGNSKVWWWIGGDTKPRQDILSAAGARWSGRRQEWYYIGENLPDAIRALETSPASPVPDAVVGDPAEWVPSEPKNLHATLTLIKHQEFPGSTNHQWKITGDPTPEEKQVLDRHGYWREQFTAWFYYQAELPPEIQAIVFMEASQTANATGFESLRSETTASDLSSTGVAVPGDISEPNADAARASSKDLESDKASAIRIIKPQSLPMEGEEPDLIQQAVQEVKSVSILGNVSSLTPDKKRVASIGQQYVGELTGDISGNVHCYGYAIHAGITVYLNLGGPHTAVEAIRAKLSKGQSVNLVPWDGPAIELTAGEGQTGKYRDFMQKIPEAKFTSLILVHELLAAPNYGGKSTTFILRTSEDQAVAKLKQHVTELVNIPVFEVWADYLWHAGQSASLVHPTQSAGEIDLWTISLDIDDWTRLITLSLEQGIIQLPQSEVQ